MLLTLCLLETADLDRDLEPIECWEKPDFLVLLDPLVDPWRDLLFEFFDPNDLFDLALEDLRLFRRFF